MHNMRHDACLVTLSLPRMHGVPPPSPGRIQSPDGHASLQRLEPVRNFVRMNVLASYMHACMRKWRDKTPSYMHAVQKPLRTDPSAQVEDRRPWPSIHSCLVCLAPLKTMSKHSCNMDEISACPSSMLSNTTCRGNASLHVESTYTWWWQRARNGKN